MENKISAENTSYLLGLFVSIIFNFLSIYVFLESYIWSFPNDFHDLEIGGLVYLAFIPTIYFFVGIVCFIACLGLSSIKIRKAEKSTKLKLLSIFLSTYILGFLIAGGLYIRFLLINFN